MAVGHSGRIVIDLDPKLKKEIHEAVRLKDKNLKEWFLEKVKEDFPEIEIET